MSRYGKGKEPLGPKWEAVIFIILVIYILGVLYFFI